MHYITMISKAAYKQLQAELTAKSITLVAVSKTRSSEEILALYRLGQRDFGENYVQELIPKYNDLPKDIRWHFIGHLQMNKVKYIAPFIHLIQSVDSLKLLTEINKQAQKNKRNINCLLEIKIGQETTKTGMDVEEATKLINSAEFNLLKNCNINGLMGIASNTGDKVKLQKEFRLLKQHFATHKNFSILSMGMSQDYQIAIDEGSSMIRLGTMLFGPIKQPV